MRWRHMCATTHSVWVRGPILATFPNYAPAESATLFVRSQRSSWPQLQNSAQGRFWIPV